MKRRDALNKMLGAVGQRMAPPERQDHAQRRRPVDLIPLYAPSPANRQRLLADKPMRRYHFEG